MTSMNKFKLLVFGIFIIILFTIPVYSQQDIIKKSQNFMDNGQYWRSIRILDKSIRDASKTPEFRSELLLKKAYMYENYSGNLTKALGYYKKIYSVNLPDYSAGYLKAYKNINRLETLINKYQNQTDILNSLNLYTRDQEIIKKQIPVICNYLEQVDNDAFTALGYYYLATMYLNSNKNMTAY